LIAQSNDFFDVVIVGSAVPDITGRYFHLLNVGGRIFVVEGKGNAMTAKLANKQQQQYNAVARFFDNGIIKIFHRLRLLEFKVFCCF
jgi:protein-L-isoaspartate O-methyltransferase